MHRVHHSIVVNETNSNFGSTCVVGPATGTYRDQPAAGHDGMTIGIEQFRVARELWSTGCCCSRSAGHGCVRDHVEERRMNKRNLVFRFDCGRGAARSDRMARSASRISSGRRAGT